MPSEQKVLSYEQAGVSVSAGDSFAKQIKKLAYRTDHHNMIAALGGYAAVYPMNETQCIALTTDGVGTKVLLAEQLGKLDTIGIDLVAMCANDLICVGATPTLFLDYYATGKLNPDKAIDVLKGIVVGCDQAGMILVGGETAEMPDVYAEGVFDLAGFAVGQVNMGNVLTGSKVEAGQTLIGIASNGVHSNGLSLARKLLTSPTDLEQLLEPTLIYVSVVQKLMQQYQDDITGLAHITGGGWKNMLRMNPMLGFEINSLPELPNVLQKLSQQNIATAELYQTFNMGIGLVLAVKQNADQMIALINESGNQAYKLGCVTADKKTINITPINLTLKDD